MQVVIVALARILPISSDERSTQGRRFLQMDEILTAGEVAELLQIHPRTVYKLVKEGSIPGRKFGGGWRFSKGEPRNRQLEIMQMISPQGPERSEQSQSTAEK